MQLHNNNLSERQKKLLEKEGKVFYEVAELEEEIKLEQHEWMYLDAWRLIRDEIHSGFSGEEPIKCSDIDRAENKFCSNRKILT